MNKMKAKEMILFIGIIVMLQIFFGCSEINTITDIKKCKFGIQNVEVHSVYPALDLNIVFSIDNPTDKELKVNDIYYEVYVPELTGDRLVADGSIGEVIIFPGRHNTVNAAVKVSLKDILTTEVFLSLGQKWLVGDRKIKIDIEAKVKIFGIADIPIKFTQKVKM